VPLWIWIAAGLGALGLMVDVYIHQWPPSPVIDKGIIGAIQKQNPSLDVNRMQSWLTNTALPRYAASTKTPSVTGYMDYVAVNTPLWAGFGAPVTTSSLYDATAATSG